MASLIWNEFFSLWESRNQVVHGADPKSTITCLKQRLLGELLRLHQDRNKMMPAHRRFLIAPTASDNQNITRYVESNNVSMIQMWTDLWVPRFHASIAQASELASRTTRYMTEFFEVVHAGGSSNC